MRLNVYKSVAILALACCLPSNLCARSPEESPAPSTPAFMDVQLDTPARFTHLKPGDMLSGKVTQNVYAGYRLMVPSGSLIGLTVSGMKRERKKHSPVWPWPIRHFLPKFKKVPVIGLADVTMPNGAKARLHVLAVSAIGKTHVATRTKTRSRTKPVAKAGHTSSHLNRADIGGHNPGLGLELVVRAERSEVPTAFAVGANLNAPSEARFQTISVGSDARLALLTGLSASRTQAGHQFKAVLMEPMRLDSGEVLPEGTVFEGHVTRSVPPRWLSRPGSLYVAFTRLVLPTETGLPIAASVSGIDVGRGARIKMNSEGGMSGGSPGSARLLLELGVGVGVSKLVDDSYQLLAEVIVSTATDASTAGTARLIGFAFSGLYMLARHGRDVTLPRYTTITVRFDRPPVLPSPGHVLQRDIMR